MGERDVMGAKWREPFTLSVSGVPFHCAARLGDRPSRPCGCNVFTKPDPTARPLVYECNACGAWYEGERDTPASVAALVTTTEAADHDQ